MSEQGTAGDQPLWSLAQALAWIRWRNDLVDGDFAGPRGSERWRNSLRYEPGFLDLPSNRKGQSSTSVTGDLLRMTKRQRAKAGRDHYYQQFNDAAAERPADALLDNLRSGDVQARWRVTEDAPLAPMPASEWVDLAIGPDAIPRRMHVAGAVKVGAAVFVVKDQVQRLWQRSSAVQSHDENLEIQGEAQLRELLADPATAHLRKSDILEQISAPSNAAKARLWKKVAAAYPARKKPGPKRPRRAGLSS